MTREKDLVVYVGQYSFPDGGAAARRIYGNCISLDKAGYNVIVTTTANEYVKKYKNINIVSVINQGVPKKNKNSFFKYLSYFNDVSLTIKWLNNLHEKPAAIILYSGYLPYMIRLVSWCKKNKVKFIFDVVEWYEPPTKISYLTSPYYVGVELSMRWLMKKCDSLIVISSFLSSYYKDKVERICIIPPTIDCSAISARIERRQDNVVRVAYTGNPGRKELLALMIEAVKRINLKGKRIEFHIAGLAISEFEIYLDSNGFNCSDLNDIVFCHGVLSHEKSLELVRSADYSFIVRPDVKSVKAGFPTKFVESLAVGTPVIANITSDLGLYLKDNFNGFVCKGIALKDLEAALEECFHIKDSQELRVNARRTAEEKFDCHLYANAISYVID